MGTAEVTPVDVEAPLIADALGVPESRVRRFSREPLGAGSISGFVLEGNGERGEDHVAYLDTSRMPVRAETGLARDDGVRVWLHPSDPHLPAFASTAFGRSADILLQRLGLPAAREVTLVGYRPGRRAVIRVRTADEDVWLKVVRPTRIARVVDAHRALSDAGLPVPEVLGWSAEGLIVMAAARGIVAAEAPWDPSALLDGVDDLRSALGAAVLPHPARESLGARLSWYVERLGSSLPADPAVLPLAGMVAPHLRPTGSASIHGDLHLGQLFLDSGILSGLIDVDTAGTGDPADDSAAFLAHAAASAWNAVAAVDRARLTALVAEAESRWAVDDTVRALTAVHLLGHALAAAERGDTPRAHDLVRTATLAAPGSKTGLMAAFDEP